MVTKINTGTSRHLVLTFEIEGDKQVAAGLDYIGKELKNFREPLKKVSQMLLSAWDRNFDSAGRELGEPWQPLAASTLKRKRSGSILQETGRMRSGFTSEVNPVSATLSNSVPYFAYHQSNQPRSKLPRRVMMKIDKQRRDEILHIFTEWLNEVAAHFSQK